LNGRSAKKQNQHFLIALKMISFLVSFILFLNLIVLIDCQQLPKCSKTILVVMSSAGEILLKNGKIPPTGFYLVNEIVLCVSVFFN
jgi:hypothetical protein